ncbi:TetR/AcrR family transcriptional regulator [Pseudomonas massiliensis]|uniref:TetR/AcrR family transcriptional regulator n=1 Tax=Pseudomonas massiliensis TaxID=522492 RepID=UPI0005902B28|nr:TetR/AcrR family transcriptional regulator [Pseudomonas massiliensis]
MTEATCDKMPKQDRSRASLERLMTATREILHDGTFEHLTIAGISKRSGVSTGSIYARFKGKDELFRAVMALVLEEIDEEWAQHIERLGKQELRLQALVPAAVGLLGDHLHRHAAMLRPFMAHAHDEHVARRGKASFRLTSESFITLLLQAREEIHHPRPEHAVASCFTIAYAAFARFFGLGSAADAAGEGDWEALKQDLGDMCLGFLMHTAHKA